MALDVVTLHVCTIRSTKPQYLVLGSMESSFAEKRRRHSCTRPSCEVSVRSRLHSIECVESSESDTDEESTLDSSPSRAPEHGPVCRGTTLDHHLRQEILATEEAKKRNQDHIRFITNCKSGLGPNYPWSNCFQIGSQILAKNECLIAETLRILTTTLEDIPDHMRSCDCHVACETGREAIVVP